MSILSFSQVTKTFGTDHTVLDTVSFSVEAGELIILTGQSGSGKTTLMKLLTREYTVTSGEIFFHDTPVHSLKLSKVHALRRQLGIVYQDYRLIRDMNVWENIATPLYIAGKNDADTEQRVSDLLNLISLTNKAEAFPSQLSGGEAQRVAIARALALGPDLIFADEPTGNLDAQTSKGIANLLGKINELGTTIIIATHDLTLLDAFLTERHLQLLAGKIVSDLQKKPVSEKSGVESASPSSAQKSDTTNSDQVERAQNIPTSVTAQSTEAPNTLQDPDSSAEDKTETTPDEKSEKTDEKSPSDRSVAQDTPTSANNDTPSQIVSSDSAEISPKKRSIWHRLTLGKQSLKQAPKQLKASLQSSKHAHQETKAAKKKQRHIKNETKD